MHTTLRQKWEGGVCSNILFVSCIRPLPPFFVIFNMYATLGTWVEWDHSLSPLTMQVALMPLSLVSINTSTADYPQYTFSEAAVLPAWKLQYSRSSNKKLSGQGYSNAPCTCLSAQSMTELNQRLLQSKPRRCSIWRVYTMEKYLCKNLGLKSREESICSKGAYFWEITIPYKRTQPPGFYWNGDTCPSSWYQANLLLPHSQGTKTRNEARGMPPYPPIATVHTSIVSQL